MTSAKKILVFLLAISILNQSIDFDYITFGFRQNNKYANYDDVDTIVELVVENLAGDPHLTHEGDDDSGMPQHKGLEKHSTTWQYCETLRKLKVEPQQSVVKWVAGIDQYNKLCKGFTEIISPPPKTIVA